MTHFVGLVIAETEDEIAALLQPFHEYECTGIDDEFVIDVDTTDALRKDFAEYGTEAQTFEQFADDWDGSELRADGRYYRHTNPNAKWDWWVVGGRWADMAPGNTFIVRDVRTHFPEWLPSVVVDADGWHAAKDWGWFGSSAPTDEPDVMAAKLAEHADRRAWVVDFHI